MKAGGQPCQHRAYDMVGVCADPSDMKMLGAREQCPELRRQFVQGESQPILADGIDIRAIDAGGVNSDCRGVHEVP